MRVLWFHGHRTDFRRALSDSAPDTPIVVVFPGLTGGAKEGARLRCRTLAAACSRACTAGYVLSMVSALRRRLHVRVLVVPGRGNHDSQLGCVSAYRAGLAPH